MSDPDPTPPNLRADAFVGTADDYVRYRIPYPRDLLAALLAKAGVTGRGQLLDLACGPGRIALDLASSFREVWAVDLEPEMIARGRLEAERRGVFNVRFAVGRAEDLEAPPAAFELVTIGEAFHRLDRPRVAAEVLGWLAPGGVLASLGCDGVIEGEEPWQAVVRDVVRQWTGLGSAAPGAPAALPPDSGPARDEAVLRAAGFVDVASEVFVQEHVWTIEDIAGSLRSTSYASRRAIGPRASAFEADLASRLSAHDPVGEFRQAIRFGFTAGRKHRPSRGGAS